MTYLDEILEQHRRDLQGRTFDLELLRQCACSVAAPRDFVGALRSRSTADGMALIAEVKRRSPSKGDLAPDLDPFRLAHDYELAGAACLSVLTDGAHFGGSPDDLRRASSGCGLPVLRKDFTISEVDLYDARLMGADAVLLIVAALDDHDLGHLAALSRELGLGALVEVHDEAELGRALDIGATMIGVNQRDLHSFAIDRERALKVGTMIPRGVLSVAESGISTADDVASLVDAGFDAILVGEALVKATEPMEVMKRLLTGVPAVRSHDARVVAGRRST